MSTNFSSTTTFPTFNDSTTTSSTSTNVAANSISSSAITTGTLTIGSTGNTFTGALSGIVGNGPNYYMGPPYYFSPDKVESPKVKVSTEEDDNGNSVLIIALDDRNHCTNKIHLFPGVTMYSNHKRPGIFRRIVLHLLFGITWESTLEERFIAQL